MRDERFIGKIGSLCVCQKMKVGWVLKSLESSMMPCKLNKCDGWFMIKSLSFTRFSRLSSSSRVIFFQLKSNRGSMLGRVFLRPDT